MINLNDFMDEAADDQEDVKEEPVEGGGVTFQLNCDQCQFSSTDLANLTKHMAATNHFPNIDPLQVGPRFDCDSCKKEFRSKHGLAIHTAKSHVVREGRKQRVSQASKEKGKVNFVFASSLHSLTKVQKIIKKSFKGAQDARHRCFVFA